ncbi:MAG: hypothetical protein NTV33_12855 [Coprothermobacterota bacterium]|nr:hypothetical protein [Coprothermobacterota bacterium]
MEDFFKEGFRLCRKEKIGLLAPVGCLGTTRYLQQYNQMIRIMDFINDSEIAQSDAIHLLSAFDSPDAMRTRFLAQISHSVLQTLQILLLHPAFQLSQISVSRRRNFNSIHA